MNYLRLDVPKEFYKDDSPALFLGDVKAVNILIGANNTRKSRFLRSLINQDFHLVVSAKPGLNDAMASYDKLFDDLKKANDAELTSPMVHFHFANTSNPDVQLLNLREFCGSKSVINVAQLMERTKNIFDTIIGVGIKNDVPALITMISQAKTAVVVLQSIYERAAKGLPDENKANIIDAGIPDVFFYNKVQYFDKYFKEKKMMLSKVRQFLDIVHDIEFEFSKTQRIFIPALRTSRMLSGVNDRDIFQDTILDQHFTKANPKIEIHTGLQLYKKILAAKNGTRKESKDFHAFETFLGRTFFQSDNLHIVARYSEKGERVIHISVTGELDDVPIQDLGDGIQGIINLLFPIFIAEEGAWVFIDEPENHLHPGYQRVFVQALSENEVIKEKKLRIFINTHSNHILSGGLFGKFTEIFVFRRRNAESSLISAFSGAEYSTLQLLGVINTSVLISNCTIWVEGVTDRFYLQAFLFAYLNSIEKTKFRPIEGYHFSFLEYGGKNILHYNFDHDLKTDDTGENPKKEIEAYFLNSNVFVLADSDFDKGKHSRFSSIERDNFAFQETKVPEIENLLPSKILEDFLIEEVKCDAEEVRLYLPLKKNDVKLGKALSGKFKYGKNFRKFEAPSGGTLRADYKKQLADFVHRKVIERKYTWKDFEQSTDLKRVVVAVYYFIKAKNL
jgi:hypothetical protein